MSKESENETERERVRFKGAGTVARARHGKGAGARSNGGPKACLNRLTQSKGHGRADLAVVGPRAPSARVRTCHGHRADALPCARAKRGARTRHILVLLRPNVIKLTVRTRQGHRAGARWLQ
ncbi:hypothetical protein PIB30_070796 [Stylosanthes scabra]|uniref:Uncharacterized protein n=1 Tax=Stylosanthes scabra TaxID=79078 RepID=A0ABU6YQF6_9FABA|nr:hypothetical protein [Stylosanthes scabra]